MNERIKDIERGINLKSTKEITYTLPNYLPDINDYVFCTADNIWRHKDSISWYIENSGGLYLRDKRVVVDEHVYLLENNLDIDKEVDKEKGDIKKEKKKEDLSNLFSQPTDIIGLLIRYVVGSSTKTFYRMCLASKKVKLLTQKYADYTAIMSVCNIGRMRLETVDIKEIDERVVRGIIISGNFCLVEICFDRVLDIILGLLDINNTNTPLYKTLKEQIQYSRITDKSNEKLRQIQKIITENNIS